jgi:deazaflavin-dependent oxidoreductase (nitroreductase family)
MTATGRRWHTAPMPSDHAWSRLSMSMPAGALRAMGRLNVPVYRLTRGRLMGKIGGAPVLLLTSTGRRSGQARTAPVLYLQDADRVVVIGSNAGNVNEPAWSHNLKANPDAEIDIRGRRRQVRARVTEGEERAELWRKMNEQYAGFDEYDERTSRNIAVFALDPR